MNKRDYIIIGLISIYIILAPLAPSAKVEWALCGLLALAGIIYLYELITKKEVREKFKNSFKGIMLDRFSILFILLIIIMTFTVTYSQNKIVSLKESLRYIYYGFLYFLIRFRVTNGKSHNVIIKAYMCSLAVVSMFGLHDFFTHYSEYKSLSEILNASRVKATLGHPNAYGAFLILGIFPVTMVALRSKGREKIIYIVLALLLSINLALTFSRNAWLAFAIGILLLAVIYNWKFIFLCIVPIIFVTLSPNILMRIAQIRDSSLNEGRLRLWKVAEKMVTEHLFTGVGSGNFIYAYESYAKRFPELQITEAKALPPHNTYIKILTELGVFGAMVFLLLCVETVKRVFEVRNYCKGLVEKFYSGYLISVICFFIMNCFDDLFFAPKVTVNFILLTSIAYSISKNEVEDITK